MLQYFILTSSKPTVKKLNSLGNTMAQQVTVVEKLGIY
jgi:hypothetical protein